VLVTELAETRQLDDFDVCGDTQALGVVDARHEDDRGFWGTRAKRVGNREVPPHVAEPDPIVRIEEEAQSCAL
jgi:hypothetical protein